MFTGRRRTTKIFIMMTMGYLLSTSLRGRCGRCPALGREGQTLTEYVIVAGVLVGVVAVLSVFLYTFREQSGRVLDLVAWDYP